MVARADAKSPKNGRVGVLLRLFAWGRNTWRTLTSMGTALVLLFLLALAAIPGALPVGGPDLQGLQVGRRQARELVVPFDPMSTDTTDGKPAGVFGVDHVDVGFLLLVLRHVDTSWGERLTPSKP